MEVPLQIPRRHPKGKPLSLRLDVVSGSYVGLDVSSTFQIEIHENEEMKREEERLKARKVRRATRLVCGASALYMPYPTTRA